MTPLLLIIPLLISITLNVIQACFYLRQTTRILELLHDILVELRTLQHWNA